MLPSLSAQRSGFEIYGVIHTSSFFQIALYSFFHRAVPLAEAVLVAEVVSRNLESIIQYISFELLPCRPIDSGPLLLRQKPALSFLPFLHAQEPTQPATFTLTPLPFRCFQRHPATSSAPQ
jgi:hypothetical protein